MDRRRTCVASPCGGCCAGVPQQIGQRALRAKGDEPRTTGRSSIGAARVPRLGARVRVRDFWLLFASFLRLRPVSNGLIAPI